MCPVYIWKTDCYSVVSTGAFHWGLALIPLMLDDIFVLSKFLLDSSKMPQPFSSGDKPMRSIRNPANRVEAASQGEEAGGSLPPSLQVSD